MGAGRQSERRRVVVAGGVLAAALAVCGSAYAVSRSHASSVALRRCQASQLTGSLVMSGGAGGHYAARGTLEDVSQQKCTLDGYVHLVPLNSSGRPARIINAAGHLSYLTSSPLRPGESTYLLFHPPSPKTVTLSHAEMAFFNLTYSDMPTGKRKTCSTLERVALRPPGSSKALTVRVTTSPLGIGLVSVCRNLSVEAVEAHSYQG
jgi:hypothetical protein